MVKTFKIIILPTEKASDLWSHKGRNLYYKQANFNDIDDEIRYYLHFVSDDEIKEGDWVIEYQKGDTQGTIQQIKNEYELAQDIQKKIVATTDKSLFIEGKCCCMKPEKGGCYQCNKELPQIHESFIQEYIKAYNECKPITEVELEMIESVGKEFGYSGEDLIKTNSDNTVIIKQNKMYSRDEVINLCTKALYEGNGIYNDTLDENDISNFIKKYL